MCCIISDWTSKVCLSGIHKTKLSHCTFTNYFVHSDITTALPFVLLTQYCASDKIKENEMGGACGTYGGEQKFVQGFGGET